jgi:hypothetical protein
MTVIARPGQNGTGLTGTGQLARLAFRRDRIALPASVYVITVLVAITAQSRPPRCCGWAWSRSRSPRPGSSAFAAATSVEPV